MESTRRTLQPKMNFVTTLSPLFVTDDKVMTVTCHTVPIRAVTVTTPAPYDHE
jgi:hypothetical protein